MACIPTPETRERESAKKVSTKDVYTSAMIAFDVVCFNGSLDTPHEGRP
jgi:hypothetical protein